MGLANVTLSNEVAGVAGVQTYPNPISRTVLLAFAKTLIAVMICFHTVGKYHKVYVHSSIKCLLVVNLCALMSKQIPRG